MMIDKEELKHFLREASNRKQSELAKENLIQFKKTWKLDQKNTMSTFSTLEKFFIIIILLIMLIVLIPKVFSPDDNFILATSNYNNNNFTDAIKYFELSCKSGNGEACTIAGVMYDDGEYVTENNEKALELYASSCKLNFTQGCKNLEMFTKTPY